MTRYKGSTEASRAACRRWRSRNPHKQKAACDKWKKNNPDKVEAAKIKSRPRVTFMARVRKYGMNEKEMRLFLDTHAFCEICGGEGQHVDHCHKTNKVRGMLCQNCNRLLGMAYDDPRILRLAILYLEEREKILASSLRKGQTVHSALDRRYV